MFALCHRTSVCRRTWNNITWYSRFFPDDAIPRVWVLTVQVTSKLHLLYQEEWQDSNFPQWISPLLCSLCYRYSLGDTGGFCLWIQKCRKVRVRGSVMERILVNSHQDCVLIIPIPPHSILRLLPGTSEAREPLWHSNQSPEIFNSHNHGLVWRFLLPGLDPHPNSVKIWLFLNLHNLGLPCSVSNPEGMQNLWNLFLQGPQGQGDPRASFPG